MNTFSKLRHLLLSWPGILGTSNSFLCMPYLTQSTTQPTSHLPFNRLLFLFWGGTRVRTTPAAVKLSRRYLSSAYVFNAAKSSLSGSFGGAEARSNNKSWAIHNARYYFSTPFTM